jgi:lipopolysaccharide/colanic/teichoic acid biosynthesis glycosyltransferase
MDRHGARTAGGETVPSGGVDTAGSAWVKGFHGSVQMAALGDLGSRSVRDLALSRRSLGVERIAILTDLPRALGPRPLPTGSGGALHVGAYDQSVVLEDADEAGEPWDGVEPLPDYIDRRLALARVVLLPNRGRAYAFAKRLLDLVGSSLLLVAAAPVMVILAMIIRLDSPGPAIFRQTRVTRGGQTFRFYKFRTMYVDARERFPALYDYANQPARSSSTYYKLADDPRNTRVGRWLRRTTLDELPNLINVLKGDLSLVGPRPELPELVRFYRPEELACFFTKAGLTGLAQVAGRSLLTVRERLTLDLRYVAHQTLLLDVRILWRTAIVVLLGKGAF